MLLRQRKVLRYERDLLLRDDLSEAGKVRVWEALLSEVRRIAPSFPVHAWQAWHHDREPAYREIEQAFQRILLDALLSSWPVPWCDGIVTLKVVDEAQLDEASLEPVPLQTLDDWPAVSGQGPLVLVCHKTVLQRLPIGFASDRKRLEERIGYLIEDPVTLHLLWQATDLEFQEERIVDGRRMMVSLTRPFYRVPAARIVEERSFLVRPSFSRFGLFWSSHCAHMPLSIPLRWVDELWDGGGIAEWLHFAADVRIEAQGEPGSQHQKSGERRACLYCTQPIDPQKVRILDSDTAPDFCSSACFVASRSRPSSLVYAQRIRRRQRKPLSPLGPLPLS